MWAADACHEQIADSAARAAQRAAQVAACEESKGLDCLSWCNSNNCNSCKCAGCERCGPLPPAAGAAAAPSEEAREASGKAVAAPIASHREPRGPAVAAAPVAAEAGGAAHGPKAECRSWCSEMFESTNGGAAAKVVVCGSAKCSACSFCAGVES